ncbi:MAG: tetratricopeptide repeat protein [Candidatus Hydrogenedens sp.]
MNNECEKYRNLILENLENNCEEIYLPEHMHLCPSCLAFYNDIQKLKNNLETLGLIIKETIPKIDVSENIKNELKKIKNGEIVVRKIVEQEDNIPEFAEWYAYIENDIDEVARYRCELRMEKSSHAKQEIENLITIHHAIDEIGRSWECPTLNEDLTYCIMEKVHEYKLFTSIEEKHSEIDVIEEQLYELSHVVSDSIRDIDIASKVAKKAKEISLKQSKKEKSPQNIVSILSVRKEKENKKYSFSNYVIPIAIAVVLCLTLLGVYLNNYFTQVDDIKQVQVATKEIGKEGQSSSKMGLYETTEPFYMKGNNILVEKIGKDTEKRTKNRKNNYAEGLLSNWTKQLKNNALENAGKLMRMGVWATLTPEEARALLQKSGLSPEAVLGAVQFLPPDEARVVLQAAIDNNPNDAYLRYAMVQTLMKMDNVSEDELYTHLTTWSQLDPGNALPHFIEAELYFQNGEKDKALTCVTDAGNTSNYNSYAAITAKVYMEALLAKGVDPETAKLLASASMGLREVQTIEEIAQTLMEYGRAYEEAGDYNTALLIYEALRSLGIKVDMSSALIQEKLAGLKYTQEAINAMFRLMNTTNSFSDTQSLIDFTQTLSEMITNYNLAMDSFYKLFDNSDPTEILQILNLYLANGNTSIPLNLSNK